MTNYCAYSPAHHNVDVAAVCAGICLQLDYLFVATWRKKKVLQLVLFVVPVPQGVSLTWTT
eukprot:5280619-Ditylum_brightwellii.AAC.1